MTAGVCAFAVIFFSENITFCNTSFSVKNLLQISEVPGLNLGGEQDILTFL
jgi:hypothetical protein